MTILVYSTDRLLASARKISPEWELGGVSDTDIIEPKAGSTPLQRVCRLQRTTLTGVDQEADSVERHEIRSATPKMDPVALSELVSTLEKRFEVATSMGLRLEPQAKLRGMLRVRLNCFRLEFGDDPPVKVAPLKVRLKPDATPTKAQPRRLPPNDRDFLERHVAKLLEKKLVYRNTRSRWASAPRIVRKKEQDYDPTADPRMTVDTRAVNDRTEAMPWTMPILEVVVGELEGAKVFFVLDWFRGYWQLPLHPDSQE
ncbi:hypothetical protein PF005_g27403 [Phytophthora fragariae]|nr:hypothetical protein PF003_g9309 [Phytophthora fragariae]KAE9069336.1 hypothetical protein PF007_g27360 [Phytophthora fragariae]KAE9170826.1 hypothetical protein PF005_g27403 [Phytophthora fragariae]